MGKFEGNHYGRINLPSVGSIELVAHEGHRRIDMMLNGKQVAFVNGDFATEVSATTDQYRASLLGDIMEGKDLSLEFQVESTRFSADLGDLDQLKKEGEITLMSDALSFLPSTLNSVGRISYKLREEGDQTYLEGTIYQRSWFDRIFNRPETKLVDLSIPLKDSASSFKGRISILDDKFKAQLACDRGGNVESCEGSISASGSDLDFGFNKVKNPSSLQGRVLGMGIIAQMDCYEYEKINSCTGAAFFSSLDLSYANFNASYDANRKIGKLVGNLQLKGEEYKLDASSQDTSLNDNNVNAEVNGVVSNSQGQVGTMSANVIVKNQKTVDMTGQAKLPQELIADLKVHLDDQGLSYIVEGSKAGSKLNKMDITGNENGVVIKNIEFDQKANVKKVTKQTITGQGMEIEFLYQIHDSVSSRKCMNHECSAEEIVEGTLQEDGSIAQDSRLTKFLKSLWA